MDRRSFFRTMIGGVAAAAAVRTWPFRVYSFPSEISGPSLFDRIGPIPDEVFCDSPIKVEALNYKDLESAYRAMVFGYDEPDLIICPDIETYRHLVRMTENLNG